MQNALPDKPASPAPPWRRLPFGLPGVLFGGFSFLTIFLFYAQPELRQHLDAYFFDLQTKLKPASAQLDDLLLVVVDDASLKSMTAGPTLSADATAAIVGKLVASKAAAIVLLLPENVLDYESAAGQQIMSLVAADPRLSLGVLGYHQREPSLRKLPHALDSVKDRVFGMDLLRKRSNDVVRNLAFTSYLGLDEQPMLPVAVARRFHGLAIGPENVYHLNFEPESAFKSVRAAELSALSPDALAGRVVVFGYTAPVAWPFMTYEQLTANTPLKYKPNTYNGGESLTLVTANAIENLLHDRSPRPLPLPLHVAYVAFLMALTYWFWRQSAILASLWVTAGFWGILWLQSLAMARFAVYFPAADAVIFASLASTLGAWQALQLGLRGYAEERALSKRDQDIAEVRSEFLDRFAGELLRINDEIGASAAKLVVPPDASATLLTARSHFLTSTKEFADYIAGILQVSRLSAADRHPEMQLFDLSALVGGIVARAAPILDGKEMRAEVATPGPVDVTSNQVIVEKILVNFLSNAIKYSPVGSVVRIEVDADLRDARVRVIDQGQGIAEEHQELIFEKFYRVRNDETYKIKGSGLGLYLCRYFTGLIGARIELASRVGAGSAFVLVLPR